jgi:hypothetical protein
MAHQRQRFADLRPDSFRDRSDKTVGSIAYPGKDSDKRFVGPLVGRFESVPREPTENPIAFPLAVPF